MMLSSVALFTVFCSFLLICSYIAFLVSSAQPSLKSVEVKLSPYIHRIEQRPSVPVDFGTTYADGRHLSELYMEVTRELALKTGTVDGVRDYTEIIRRARRRTDKQPNSCQERSLQEVKVTAAALREVGVEAEVSVEVREPSSAFCHLWIQNETRKRKQLIIAKAIFSRQDSKHVICKFRRNGHRPSVVILSQEACGTPIAVYAIKSSGQNIVN